MTLTDPAGKPRSRPSASPIAESMRCPMDGCGRPLAGVQPRDGEVVVHVAGSGSPALVYCGGSCASRGIARLELHHHLLPEQRPRDVQPVATLPQRAAVPTTVGYRPHGPGTASQERKARLDNVGASVVEVREWARAHGHHVGVKGVPSGAVVTAFLAAREQVGA